MSQQKQKCVNLTATASLSPATWPTLGEEQLKIVPPQKLCETTWLQCRTGSHFSVLSSHPSYLACLPLPSPDPAQHWLPRADVKHAEKLMIWFADWTEKWGFWVNPKWNPSLPPTPKIWKRIPQTRIFKSELNILFWSLDKALSCVLLGQNKQRRNKGRITRDRK